MKIGLLIYGDMNDLSGGYLYNRLLVDYLRRMGDEVCVFTIPHASYWQHVINQLGEKRFAQIRAAKLDILIQDELTHPSLVFSNQHLARRCKLPLISLVHLFNSFDHHPWYSCWLVRALERRYLASVHGFILNSRTTQAQARQLLDNKLPPHCIAVPAGNHFTMAPPATAHNPAPKAPIVRIDKESLHQRMTAIGPLRILAVGNIIRRKATHLILEALSQLDTDSYEVTLVGRVDMEPDYVAELGAMIEKFQLQDSVKILGPLSGIPLIQHYQEHHVMVLPSAFESYGIVYVEAQQFGLPVIGTRAGAAHEIIQQGENGYLIPPGNAHALAMDLQFLHQHRGTLWTMSQNALDAFAEHPTWDQSNEITRQFLLSFVNKPSP